MVDPRVDRFLTELESNQEFDGRFSSIRRLGVDGGGGHFSLVLRAHDNKSRTPVALKILNPFKRLDPYRLASFEREATILHDLKGQRDILQLVTPIAEAYSSQVATTPIQYFAVELAACSIGDRLADRNWSPLERLRTFRGMCRALQRLHSYGYVHRDLKPDNFLLTSDNQIRLSDFGTAAGNLPETKRLLDSYIRSDGTAFFPGDKRYQAPEMIAGLHDQHPEWMNAADVFALGAILYELFADGILSAEIDLYTRTQLSMMDLELYPDSASFSDHQTLANTLMHIIDMPSLTMIPTSLPASVHHIVDYIFQQMCDLRFYRRISKFETVFLRLARSERIIENQIREDARRQRLRRIRGRRTG